MKNMKKLLTISIMALIATVAFAGDGENELKNFRFGLKVTPSVNWFKPEGKIMASNGAGVKFGGGLVLEFRLAKVISIQTGVQIDMDGGKIKYNNGGLTNPSANSVSYFYHITDDKIVEYDSANNNDPAYKHYQLNERQYKVTYITIPLALKMKTKEIGNMTYFGQIGVNTSIRWKATVNDKVTVINDTPLPTLGATDSKSKVDVTKDVSLIHETLNFGLGTELNLSGSTSIVFGLNYNLGFTNVVKRGSDYLGRRVNGANSSTNPIDFTLSKMPQSFKSNAVILTIGVLF